MTLTFINQSAPETKRKLQRLEHPREKSSRDLVMVAKKVYTGRVRSEEKEVKKEWYKNQHLPSVLLAAPTQMKNARGNRYARWLERSTRN